MGLKKLLIDSGDEFRQRSLGYGDNAPLITKDLPKVSEAGTNQNIGIVSAINTLTDGIIPGGGAMALGRAATDTARITKFLLTGDGISFIAKDAIGQRMNPQSLISPTNRTRTPLNLLAQIPSNIGGLHFRRDGLADTTFEKGTNYDFSTYNPITSIGPFTNKKYETELATLRRLDKDDIFVETTLQGSSPHTLLGIYKFLGTTPESSIIKEYPGGSDSIFGIGNTTIKRYENTSDLANNRYGATQMTPMVEPAEVKERIRYFGLGSPGERKIKEQDGSYTVNVENTKDRINIADIYARESFNEDNAPDVKDFIRFKIAMVDTTNPLNDEVLLFRAFLEGIQDNFSGKWNSHKYNGRAENFYTYDGFDRNISFSFKISAQSVVELKPLYTKLNYLVGSTAPVYSNRRMRGRYVRLTIGNWFNEMPGFFTNINLGWETNFPWELNIGGPEYPGLNDKTSQHPHILNVNCTFQPIHDFTPEHKIDTPFIIPKGFNYIETEKPADAPPPLNRKSTLNIPGGSDSVSSDSIGLQQPAQLDIPEPEYLNAKFVRYFSRGSGDLREGDFEPIDRLGLTDASEGLGGRIDFGNVAYIPEMVDDENPTNVVNLLSGLEANVGPKPPPVPPPALTEEQAAEIAQNNLERKRFGMF
jgi:hypothetical protein